MKKYSKYRLSVGSIIFFVVVFCLVYFADTYEAFLADSLDAIEMENSSEQQVNLVTDLEIEHVEEPTISEIEAVSGDVVGGENVDSVGDVAILETVTQDGVVDLQSVSDLGDLDKDVLMDNADQDVDVGASSDVEIAPIDPMVVENPQIPEECRWMIAGGASEAPVSDVMLEQGSATVEVEPGMEEVVPVVEVPTVEEVVPAGEAPVIEEVVPVDEIPVEEQAPAVDQVPVLEEPPVVEEIPVIEEIAPVEIPVVDPAVSAESSVTEVEVLQSVSYTPEDCQKYLDAVKVNVPELEVLPDIVEDDLLEREFSLAAVNDELQMQTLKSERQQKLRELIVDYYFGEHAEDDNYRFLGNNIFYLRLGIDDIYESEVEGSLEFSLIDQYADFIDEKGLFYIDLVFSEDLNYDSLLPSNFVIESLEGEKIVPQKVFAYRNTVILLYESELMPDASLLNLSGVAPSSSIVGDATGSDLNGYLSLQTEDDDYIEAAKEAQTQYAAYIADDITFAATKMSFGDFNRYVEGDSTIAVEIGNASGLNNQCAILVFGNNLLQDGGSDEIPVDGLKLITQSTGGVPIDAEVIKNFELQKSKLFIGFVYLKDLEFVNDSYALYLNLSVPAGLEKGAYRNDFSFEIFCPDGGSPVL